MQHMKARMWNNKVKYGQLCNHLFNYEEKSDPNIWRKLFLKIQEIQKVKRYAQIFY